MKLVILDRDGVINYDSHDFIKSPAEWIPIPQSLQAIAKLTQAGYEVLIATNQSGLGRGYYTEETLEAIHAKLHEYVEIYGGKIAAIQYCPHLPEANCDCRKPKPGLLINLAARYGVTPKNIPVIGDSLRDMQAALAVEAKPILVLTGLDADVEQKVKTLDSTIPVYANLAKAAEDIINKTC